MALLYANVVNFCLISVECDLFNFTNYLSSIHTTFGYLIYNINKPICEVMYYNFPYPFR